MVPPRRIKALQRADILQGTCPTIVSSPSIRLMTATESGSCELLTSRRQYNSSPGVGFSHNYFVHMKPTNRRKY